MSDRHPVLARLDALVGRWTVQPHVDGVGAAWAEFSWHDGGAFLRQYSDADPQPQGAPQGWGDNAPYPTTWLIGLDDAGEEFTALYADARGVHRVYRMTYADGLWSLWRDAPGFAQRFTATTSADGHTMTGRWDLCTDGHTWNPDFELTYTRDR